MHGAAVGDVGSHCDGAATDFLDLSLELFDPLRAARDQHDGGTPGGQHLCKAHTQAAGRAGNQRHLAGEVEQLGCIHTGIILGGRGTVGVLEF